MKNYTVAQLVDAYRMGRSERRFLARKEMKRRIEAQRPEVYEYLLDHRTPACPVPPDLDGLFSGCRKYYPALYTGGQYPNATISIRDLVA